MYRVKETQKKTWTNKSFYDHQKGNTLNVSTKKDNPEPKSSQGQKTNQEPKVNQGPKSNLKPEWYQDQNKNNINGQKNHPWQTANKNQKFKHFNQGAKGYEGTKSQQVPNFFQKPRIYPGQEAFRKPMKYKDYKVPEISVSELCRTLTGLKAMEDAKNNGSNDNAGQANNQKSGQPQVNEPFFASNLEYYPHLPQVYYSEEYQTFAELKAMVCKGDLTQVKPPVNNNYHFVSEWREANQTPEQRQAYLRNQRALTAQRIGRHERLKQEQEKQQEQQEQEKQEQDASKSNATGADFKQAKASGRGPVYDWFETSKKMDRQRKFCLQQAELYMQDQRGMESEVHRQKDQKKQQQQQEKEREKQLYAGFAKDQKELKARRQKQKEEKGQQKLKTIEEREENDKEQQQELKTRSQKQKKAMAFVAQLQMEFEEQKQEKEEAKARRQSQQKEERAKTGQRVGPETRLYFGQRQYDFSFASKYAGRVTAEQLSKMPTMPAVPCAPLPSQLPQPMASMFNGGTPSGTGYGTGNDTGNGCKYPEQGYAGASTSSFYPK
ncbi:hypothetical protein KR038_001341 [Drosophila bunnanda]|nr:hypothetical protein KR038_001341 [Drosophila bunnanda]